MRGRAPLGREIALEREVHCPTAALARTGDLDNFITGVCEAADPRIKRDSAWSQATLGAIRPDRSNRDCR